MTLRIVSETSDVEIRRKEALEEVDLALRELTANLMRIVRGAGKSYEVFRQINRCRAAFLQYHEASGCLPSSSEIDRLLAIRRKADELYKCADEQSHARWSADGTFMIAAAEDIIRAGVLRAVSAELVGQRLQECNGENELHDGLRMYEQFREERRRARAAEKQIDNARRGTKGKRSRRLST